MEYNKHDLPENWKWVTLNEIGVVTSGGTPSTKEPEFWDGDVAWITPADLSNFNEIYISKGQRNISRIGLDHSSAILLPKNSIIFSSRAPIGYVAITSTSVSTNQGFKNLVLPQSISSKYVFYYLKSAKQLAESFASGTTFKEISSARFKQIPFPLAPLNEQNRIVEKIEELFSEIDKSIENLNRSILDVDRYVMSTLKKAFNFEKRSIAFKKVLLKQICTINYGKSLPQESRLDGDVPVYGSNGLIGYHNDSVTSGPTIIIGRKGSVGELRLSSVPCYPIDTTYYIEENSSFDLTFLFHQLKIKNLASLNKATTIPGLNRDSLYGVSIVFPNSLDEQKKISEEVEERLQDVYSGKSSHTISFQTVQSSCIVYSRAILPFS